LPKFTHSNSRRPFFEVHKELGVGFREYIYTRALERLLIATGHKVEREVATNLEVGLVLYLGKKARVYRVFFENRFKQRNQRCP
jgi:hypothetical protein